MVDDWRNLLFRVGWGRTRPHAVADAALERRRTRDARYRQFRDAGLEALAVADWGAAIEHLAAAAILFRGLPEAHVNLARAFEAAGKSEAARQTLEIGLHLARTVRNSSGIAEMEARYEELPSPPPTRQDFVKDQVLYSGLTNSRWTVLEAKFGGMGAVYKVRDHADGVIHALKTLQAQHLWSESDRDRFIREAATWVRVDPHPNIISAEWVEVIEDFPCIVMEFIEGGDLEALLASQALSIDRAIGLAIQFCDGMSFAHKTLGIVHRDVKPANCLLTTQGALKIGDFGLARSFLGRRAAALELSGIPTDLRVQLTSPYGTKPYMAPEQQDPEASLDCRTDVHAFGVMLYEMITSDLPPDDLDQPGRVDREHIRLTARRHKAPKRLLTLVLSCVDPEPAERPGSFDDVRLELARVLRTRYRRQAPAPSGPTPVDARYWNNKAVAFQSLEQYDDAIGCYDRALQLTPADPDLWQNRGVALLCKKHYQEAITSFDRGLKLAPRDADILSNKGLAQLRLGERARALECMRKAIDLAPRDPLICKNLAEVLCESGKADEALEWIRKGLVFDSRNPALLELEGLALLALGCVDQAIGCFDQGLAIAPHSFGLWKGKAIAHGRRGEHAESLDACNKALEVSADDVSALRYKGEALIGLGQLKLARASTDLLLTFSPDDTSGRALAARLDVLCEASAASRGAMPTVSDPGA